LLGEKIFEKQKNLYPFLSCRCENCILSPRRV
jgi:hypothetical protein